jgi:hypothetical protein
VFFKAKTLASKNGRPVCADVLYVKERESVSLTPVFIIIAVGIRSDNIKKYENFEGRQVH